MGSGGTVLGIGISAVHDAVLRGGARIPETIVNEHPVTIYPGRASPAKKVPPRTLPGLIDRHRDVCRKSIDSSQELAIIGDSLMTFDSNESLDITVDDEQSKVTILNQSPSTKIIFNNKVTIEPCSSQLVDHARMDDDEFSDDSLEDKSLPLPLPPPSLSEQPIVPPPSSLSAPVSPNKRSSIAWEININDDDDHINHLNEAKATKTAMKLIGSSNVIGSQTSVASTPCNSITSTELSCSSDWPDPPEPPICSTEDEAGSLYTDSEDLIPFNPTGIRNGTYVIRKGRERPHLFDLEAFATAVLPGTDTEPESLNIEEEEERIEDIQEETTENLERENEENLPPLPSTIPTTNYRHSIDLARPTPVQHSLGHSPR